MVYTSKVPSKTVLESWVEEGLTRQQMVDRIYEQDGIKVTPAGISLAMDRYGMPKRMPRYRDQLPWRVRKEHLLHEDARFLRWLGRREAGNKLGPRYERELNQWLEDLRADSAVVHYNPDTEEGFMWVPRIPEDGDSVIRKPEVEAERLRRKK